MNNITNISLFIITFLVATILKKYESIVAILLTSILALLMYFNNLTSRQRIILIIFGVIMATTEYICIKYFDMWKYNFVYYDIPLWLPFAWSITGVFLLTIYK